MRDALLIVLVAAVVLVAWRAWAAGAGTSAATQTGGSLAAPKEFAALIGRPDHVLLDVRKPAEHAAGHIAAPASKLLDFASADFPRQVAELPRDKTYLVYCRSGRRSHAAVAQMQSLGFAHLVDLQGGILAWQKAGQPVEK